MRLSRRLVGVLLLAALSGGCDSTQPQTVEEQTLSSGITAVVFSVVQVVEVPSQGLEMTVDRRIGYDRQTARNSPPGYGGRRRRPDDKYRWHGACQKPRRRPSRPRAVNSSVPLPRPLEVDVESYSSVIS